MFFGRASLIYHIVELEQLGPDRFSTHFTTTHTFTMRPAPPHFFMDILTQAGPAISGHNIGRGDIADDPVDAAVTRNRRLDVGDQIDQFFGGVGFEFPALPVLI